MWVGWGTRGVLCVRFSTRGELRTPGSLLDNIYFALVRRLISCKDAGAKFLLGLHVMRAPFNAPRSLLSTSKVSEDFSSSWRSKCSSSDLLWVILVFFSFVSSIFHQVKREILLIHCEAKRLTRSQNSHCPRSHVTCHLMWSLNVCNCKVEFEISPCEDCRLSTLPGFFRGFGLRSLSRSKTRTQFDGVCVKRPVDCVRLTTQVQRLCFFHSSTNKDIYGIVCYEQYGRGFYKKILCLYKAFNMLISSEHSKCLSLHSGGIFA